jgi:hypothetical protein
VDDIVAGSRLKTSCVHQTRCAPLAIIPAATKLRRRTQRAPGRRRGRRQKNAMIKHLLANTQTVLLVGAVIAAIIAVSHIVGSAPSGP